MGKNDQFYTKPLNINILESTYNDSSKTTPVIFIMSAGVDPWPQLSQFA